MWCRFTHTITVIFAFVTPEKVLVRALMEDFTGQLTFKLVDLGGHEVHKIALRETAAEEDDRARFTVIVFHESLD